MQVQSQPYENRNYNIKEKEEEAEAERKYIDRNHMWPRYLQMNMSKYMHRYACRHRSIWKQKKSH